MSENSFFAGRDATLQARFSSQVYKHPDKIALVDGAVTLTYRELDTLSNRLANCLQQYDIEANDAVGILLEKCHEYIIACLAILKAGGAYLHLESAYPTHFLREIYTDASPKVVITKRRHESKVMDVNALFIDDGAWRSADSSPVDSNNINDDLAIIGYSSGSTGKPKGICVSHRATLYAYYHFWRELRDIPAKGRFAYTAFLTWDALSPLVMGETGYMIPDEISYDPHRLLDYIAQHKINHTFLTPSLLSTILQTVDHAMIRAKLSCLNVAWVGGEVTTQPLVDETLALLPHLALINNYGPAECFVITQGQLRVNDSAIASICTVGHVLDGMEIVIMDEEMEVVAQGEIGELYATGPCLADGYLNNPTLTRQKFIPLNGKTFYKTGDLARCLEDGRLVILGRRDSTVKIRSYNVNLSAIEETLRQHSQITDCVVMAYGEAGGDKHLVAYLIGDDLHIDPDSYNCPTIVGYLQQYVPFYMVPRLYVELDVLPIHPISGKLDRSVLPRLTVEKPSNALIKLPKNATIAEQEQVIVALLQELLPHGNIKPCDSFFELGLHSLLAAQLTSRINELFGIALSVVTVYERDSAEKLVAHINGKTTKPTINWQKEAILENTIHAHPICTTFTTNSDAVFLTGATGYLGGFLLAELLCLSPTLNVYCLLRSESRLPALIERLKFYQLWNDNFQGRIIPLVGDLEQPRFGWTQATFERYAAQMDAVFHAGAWVNMVYPYQRIKATNVGGTQEVIRFATCCTTKPLHYISTLGIFPAGNVSQYREDKQIDHLIDRLNLGYTQSKWVAEQLAFQAIERDIPVQIYRIGNLGPDSITRKANDNDTIMLLLDACKTLRIAPDKGANWVFEYTPVNFVTHAIVQTALTPHTVSDIFHISGQNLIPANSVFLEMRRRDLIDQIMPLDKWLQRLHNITVTDSGYALLAQSLPIEEEFLLDDELFDISLFKEQTGTQPPAINEEYLIDAIFPKPFGQ